MGGDSNMKKKIYGVTKSSSISKSTSVSPNKKITKTKSKLGTTKPVKSVTSRKVNKWGTTTTLPFVPFHPWPDKAYWWRRLIEKFWRWVR